MYAAKDDKHKGAHVRSYHNAGRGRSIEQFLVRAHDAQIKKCSFELVCVSCEYVDETRAAVVIELLYAMDGFSH